MNELKNCTLKNTSFFKYINVNEIIKFVKKYL